MKKHNVVAIVGTLALLANLLVPGLAFGQGAQQGTADLDCSAAQPTFSAFTPEAVFPFGNTGSAPWEMTSLSVDQNAYNNPSGSALTVTNGNDFVSVIDVRDPEDAANCNDGLTLVLAAINPGGVGEVPQRFFDGGVGKTIPLNTTYVVTSADTCPVGYTEDAVSSDVCFKNDALCGHTTGNESGACDGSQGVTTADYTGTGFGPQAPALISDTYSVTLGTEANTPAPRTLLSFTDAKELYGSAGVGVSYAVTIPGGTATGTYLLDLQYTVS